MKVRLELSIREVSKGKRPEAKQVPSLSKSKARESFNSYQRMIGVIFIASALFGIYLLSTDLSLWILAVSHAYGLIVICVIDVALAIANFLLIRKVLIPSMFWAGLTLILQLGDILTAPQYKMTMLYFATYLFGLWAFDALVISQLLVMALALFSRRYAKYVATKKKITYFDMGLKNSRRDFIQIMGVIVGLVALTGVLGALDVISTSGNQSTSNSNTTATDTNTLPSGAIVNVSSLEVGKPTYFDYPSAGYPSMLLKKSNGTLIAISLLCTHACCECNYQTNTATFFCPCHGSIFDQNGNVTQGPASVPLPLIELNVDGNGNVFPVKFKSSSPCLSG